MPEVCIIFSTSYIVRCIRIISVVATFSVHHKFLSLQGLGTENFIELQFLLVVMGMVDM